MTDLGWLHPIVVHFVVALGLVGVALRWTAIAGRVRFAGPAACLLIVLAAGAALVAARSGEDASVLVEPVPGTSTLVAAHRGWGTWTRDLLLATAAFELLAAWRPRVRIGAALVGAAAAFGIVQTGARGGELVYAHAAGVGVRSGEPADVDRLLLAALVQHANLDDRRSDPAAAAALIDLAARRFPRDVEVQLLDAASLLRRHRAADALAMLERTPAPDEPQPRFRLGWLTADALEALGRSDDAAVALDRLAQAFPADDRLARRRARHAAPRS